MSAPIGHVLIHKLRFVNQTFIKSYRGCGFRPGLTRPTLKGWLSICRPAQYVHIPGTLPYRKRKLLLSTPDTSLTMPRYQIALYTVLAAASQALAATSNVSCTPYVPVGWNSSHGKINFYDNVSWPPKSGLLRFLLITLSQNPNDVPYNGKGFHANTLPANATSTELHGFKLANAGFSGQDFAFSTCNVSSLGLTNQTQSSCG